MERIPASISEADFIHLTRRAGLELDENERKTLYDVYGNFETMLARVRGRHGQDRARGAEPAHIFIPTQGWTAP